jgi:hypothetical protein
MPFTHRETKKEENAVATDNETEKTCRRVKFFHDGGGVVAFASLRLCVCVFVEMSPLMKPSLHVNIDEPPTLS